MSTTTDQLTHQLALVRQQIEEHETAIWLLQQRRDELRLQLRAVSFAPPVHPAHAELRNDTP